MKSIIGYEYNNITIVYVYMCHTTTWFCSFLCFKVEFGLCMFVIVVNLFFLILCICAYVYVMPLLLWFLDQLIDWPFNLIFKPLILFHEYTLVWFWCSTIWAFTCENKFKILRFTQYCMFEILCTPTLILILIIIRKLSQKEL
jgi:hypothetical protein